MNSDFHYTKILTDFTRPLTFLGGRPRKYQKAVRAREGRVTSYKQKSYKMIEITRFSSYKALAWQLCVVYTLCLPIYHIKKVPSKNIAFWAFWSHN